MEENNELVEKKEEVNDSERGSIGVLLITWIALLIGIIIYVALIIK